MGWPTGIKIDGDSCQNNANNGLLKVKNTVISAANLNLDSAATTTAWGISAWYGTAGWDNMIYAANTDVMLTNPFDYTNPNFRPSAGSPVLTGASFADPFLASGFSTVTFRGAFGADDWTVDWTNFNPDTANYNYGYIPVGLNEVNLTKLDVNVYPNPATNDASVSFTVKENATINFEVVDLNGKVMFAQKQNVNKGFNAIHFSTENFANGFYIIKLSGGNYTAAEKLSVLR
jgi:hypothetical protein